MWFRALTAASITTAFAFLACGDTYESAAEPVDAGAGTETGTSPPRIEAGVTPTGPVCDPRKPFAKVERVPGIPTNGKCFHSVPDEHIAFYSIDTEVRSATRDDAGVYGIGTKLQFETGQPSCASISADRTVVYYEDYFAVLQQSGPPGGPYAQKTPVAGPPGIALSSPFYDEPRQQLYATLHIEKGYYFGNYAIGVAAITGGSVGEFRRVDVGFGVTGGDTPRDADTPVYYRYDQPVVSGDGLAIYYATLRTDDGGIDDSNIWVSTRTSLQTDFGRPERLDSASSLYIDAPMWVSPDGCRLYLHSNRDRPTEYGAFDSFVATREP